MSHRDTLKRHASLVDEMATTLGIDLQEAAIGGALRVDEISEAVLRCSDCPNPGHCESFLAENKAVSRTPEYCQNQELLRRLMP